MRIIGYVRGDFTSKGGTEIKGMNVFITSEIDKTRGAGSAAERVYLTDAKLEREGIDLAALLGKEVKVYYNRYGKVDSIIAVR